MKLSTAPRFPGSFRPLIALVIAATLAPWPTRGVAEPLRHAIAMHDEPALPADFTHFPHVNPDAPKGGRLTIGVAGSFEHLNAFVPGGSSPPEVRELTIESLMMRSRGERFSLYPLIAERVEAPADRRSITFHLNAKARFSDGMPITTRDVKTSFDLLREHGFPFYRSLYKSVRTVEVLGPLQIRFVLDDSGDREAPLLIGLMPVFAAHSLTVDGFKSRTLTPLVGSGPYAVASIDPGRSIVYRRRADHWARDLPGYRGRYNFDEVRVDYLRDPTALMEAFRAGDIDVRFEDNPTQWLRGYDFPAARDGRVVRREVESPLPAGFTALVFNTRRRPLDDPRVRRGLALAFDGEWLNQNLYHGLYRRAASLFPRSDLGAVGTPVSDAERELLGPDLAGIDPEILEGRWRPATASTPGEVRRNLARAIELLKEAGFRLAGSNLVDGAGRPLELEFVAQTRAQERMMLLVQDMWRRIGVTVTIRLIDPAQFWKRLTSREYDMLQWTWGASLSPGNEQANRWSSEAASREGTLNLAGIRSPAVDRAIAGLTRARTIHELVTAARALDRAVLTQHAVIPLFYPDRLWVAHWRRIQMPDRPSFAPTETDSWWRIDVP